MSKARAFLPVVALLAMVSAGLAWMLRSTARQAAELDSPQSTDSFLPKVSVFRAEWSADSRQVVTLVRGLVLGSPLVVHDLAGDSAPWPIDIGNMQVSTIALSSDGRHLLIGTQDGRVVWFSMESSAQIVLWTAGTTETAITAAKISQNGRFAIVGTSAGDVVLCDTSGQDGPWAWKGHVANVTTIELSSDERSILTTSMDYSAVVWKLCNRREIRRLRQDVPLKCGAFSSDGREVMLAGLGPQMWNYDVETGRNNWQSKLNPLGSMSMSLSPDGSTLATAGIDKKIMLWDAKTGVAKRELGEHLRAVSHVRYSTDGSKLISAGLEGFVLVWDIETGQVATRIDCGWLADTAR